MAKLIAIDPATCGCTECIIGEYVPLDRATPEQVKAALRGELRDHTNGALEEFKERYRRRKADLFRKVLGEFTDELVEVQRRSRF